MEVFNTLGRALQELVPGEGNAIRVYSCGPTVQSEPHLGHGRQAVVFDVVRRYLEWRGFDVTFVMNITDVEDKIIAQADERGISTDQVVAEATAGFLGGYRRLGVREPDLMPRATDHIPEMIGVIERLIAGGHAYAADGDVYFAVRSFDGYGKLSGRNLDDLLAGARVEPGEAKRDPLDFALWKAAKEGEPAWDSPWGRGRPGWHIECSAMAEKYLGFGFEIHGGGSDLIFPHHENEIAQAEAAAGDEPFARYWMHNGLLNLAGDKMAKSTGNLIGLSEALERWRPEAVRLFYLRKHYRAPQDFSVEALEDAEGQLERLWSFRRRVDGEAGTPDDATLDRFREAMDDDFNTAEALAALFDAVSAGNVAIDGGGDAGPYVAAYDEIVAVLGLAEEAADLSDLAEELSALAARIGVADGEPSDVVERLVAEREAARRAADYGKADAVRNGLATIGIGIEDTPDGSRWHRA